MVSLLVSPAAITGVEVVGAATVGELQGIATAHSARSNPRSTLRSVAVPAASNACVRQR